MLAGSDSHRYDLLIIGGGITGAALAYLASHSDPPLRVLLLESGELAAGTSSRSSRFLHGGLRYLAQGRLALVKHLLEGRAELAMLAPHLVRPAPFILPLGPDNPHPAWILRGALRLYGALERRNLRAADVPAARHLDAAAARRAEPLLSGVALDGALTYGELSVDDAGLVRALAQGAQAAGATVRTHVRCDGLLRDRAERVVGVTAQDRRDGDRIRLHAGTVIDATGPWSGQWHGYGHGYGHGHGSDSGRAVIGQGHATHHRVTGMPRLARGTHVVLPHAALPLRQTVVFFSPRDGRALFASPRGGEVVVGTTDVEHHGSADAFTPTDGEIAYLLDALAGALPAFRTQCGVSIRAFAGLRPLAATGTRWGAGAGPVTGALDRDYAVTWDEPGLLAVRGGKLTLALHGARRALATVASERQAMGLSRLTVPGVGTLRRPLPALPPLPNATVTTTSHEHQSSLTWRAA